MKLTIFTIAAFFAFSLGVSAQEQVTDSLEGQKVVLDEVFVSAVRVTKQSPVTFSNLTKEEIKPRNLGQDIPVLMNFLPSVVTTTDAGAGVGYTGLRVRGSDATRVNVTINGIPYNDAESQGTFWVNMPDFASSKFSTGLLNDHVEISGRLSKIKSDGYIDRARSDLESYFLQAAYKDDNTLIKALMFGGHEITYQAWYGIDGQTLRDNRTFNPSGIYTDLDGNTQFYDNEVDNYKQDHAQLLWNEQISDFWSTNIALHYTRGRGYFEQYREADDFSTYGFEPLIVDGEEVNTTDLIRRRWLDNDFYGTVFSANYKKEKLDLIIGGGLNKYEGDHFGEVIWARYASNSSYRDRYYDDSSSKTDFNLYTKANYQLTDQWSLYGDVQYRTVGYKANGEDTGLVDDTFNFFNPKAGVTFDLNANNNFYLSYAVANREPNRNDYENGNPKPEKLNDFELGWRYVSPSVQVNTNVYYMNYKDQLVVTGELNDVGAPLRENIGDSYRLGLEVDANIILGEKFSLRPNIAISQNKNKDFFIDRDGLLQGLGDTNIAYSPGFVAGNVLSYMPCDAMNISLYSKFVGEQYLSNTDTEASKLDSYFTTDFNITYEINMNSIVKSIVFSGLVNNIFNEKYVSNGYTYVDSWSTPGNSFEVQGYYPQAGTNFLLGATVNF